MSGCALRRWGSGTPCQRPQADTPAAKEMEAKLAAMRAEREKQDVALWGSPFVESQPVKGQPAPASASNTSAY